MEATLRKIKYLNVFSYLRFSILAFVIQLDESLDECFPSLVEEIHFKRIDC